MKNNNNRNKIILIAVAITLCIIFSILISIISVSTLNNDKDSSYIINNELADIIKQLGSVYIKESESAEKGYNKDIYINFKYDLYVNKESKQEDYEKIIKEIALNQKSNLRLIDESKNIIIRINYSNTENTYYYTINGEKNYFEKQNSIIALENYKEFENKEIRIHSEELKKVIEAGWKYETEIFGTKDARCNSYDIYFDEGIEVRAINGKIYNIVFNKNYDGKVVNNIEVARNLNQIEDVMGKPTFSSKDAIGYKNEDIYVIFSNENISIYRNQEYEYKDFVEYLDKYFKNEINVKEFINELTYIWPEYSDYNYDSSYVYLNYAKQGIELNLNIDNQIITIYNNCDNIEIFSPYIKQGKIITKLEEDSVFIAECNRIKYNNEQKNKKATESEEYIGKSNNFNEKVLTNKVEFYSLNKNYPNCTLIESITSYFWLEDNIFIYSISGKGIYYFDLNEIKSHELLLGEDDYEFKDFSNGVLTYDDEKTIEIGSD